MKIREAVLKEDIKAISKFLSTYNLVYEDDIDMTLYMEEAGRIIATVSSAEHIIKCVAVDETYQGQHLLNTLMSKLIKQLNEKGHDHLFVYTQPEHIGIFRSLGFKEIVQTMNLTFMELHGDIEQTLKRLKRKYDLDNRAKGAVVINANPFTKGHLHLIEEASKLHEQIIVFVVSEDRSFFPFEDRFEIIKNSFRHRPDIHVLPSKDYLVSFATFPKYFLKQEQSIKKEHALIDVLTFKQHYMRIFNINARYVGEEPYSPMTDVYNQTMKEYLGSALKIVERKTIDTVPISASTVRKLLKKNGLDTVRKYVPEATYDYLISDKGQRVIRRLKRHESRH